MGQGAEAGADQEAEHASGDQVPERNDEEPLRECAEEPCPCHCEGKRRCDILRGFRVPISSFFISDNTFVLLGGQHIAAALRKLYDHYKKERNFSEEKIPNTVRFVEAEILRADTPLEVCRLAAGQHQALQCQVKGISSEDAFALFQQTALEYLESRGQPWMTDAEMWQVLQQLGVQYQAKKADTKEKSPEEQVQHIF